jgi:septum site-determining protein MinD
MGKTIGVISLKGGVGKTSVVVALGSAMADLGKKVLLVDANLSAPNLGVHLDVLNPEVTLHHVLCKKAHLKHAVHKLDKFDLLPASLFERVQVNPLRLKEKLRYTRKKYDVVLIDSSPALNDETLAVMLASDELVVVTTPDYPTLSTTLKAVKKAQQRDAPIVGLILNKVHDKNFEISLEDIENTLDLPILAVIPHDLNVLKALSQFIPSTDFKKNSKSSEEYRRLAASLLGERYKPTKLKKLFRWINPKKQDINREIYYNNVFS